jgi:hypothetical protein
VVTRMADKDRDLLKPLHNGGSLCRPRAHGHTAEDIRRDALRN